MTDDRPTRTQQMRNLSDDDRQEAIDSSDNVMGFDKFAHRAKQVQISQSYRAPMKLPPKGAA